MPKNPKKNPVWPDRVPVSTFDLVNERRRMRIVARDRYNEPNVEFTCDSCSLARSCALAFDIYNTNGDCLAIK